jgi:hypothetical protein
MAARRDGNAPICFAYPPGTKGTLLLLGLCAGCGPMMNVYDGPGALRASGSPATELLGQSVAITHCPRDAETRPPATQFAVLAIGDHCTLDVEGTLERMRPASNALCTLSFSHAEYTLRVTDVVIRYGDTVISPAYGGTEFAQQGDVETSYVWVQLGGDDIKSGAHASYSFSGHADAQEAAGDICVRERDRPQSAVARRQGSGG